MDQKIKKDTGKTRLDLIPVESVLALGRVLTFGAEKYHDNSWREGMNYSRIYAATQRHLQAFWGEDSDIDGESKLSHLSHAFCNIAFLLTYEENKERYRIFDDRAGSDNAFYKKQEKLVQNITELVQDHSDFFEHSVGDGRTWAGRLQKVYDTLNYAIHTTDDGIADEPNFPDLTTMSHPEACEHLEVGMRVLLLHRAEDHEKDWINVWVNEMGGGRIGNIYTVRAINPITGVTFIEIGYEYPAFVLEIISRPEDVE